LFGISSFFATHQLVLTTELEGVISASQEVR